MHLHTRCLPSSLYSLVHSLLTLPGLLYNIKFLPEPVGLATNEPRLLTFLSRDWRERRQSVFSRTLKWPVQPGNLPAGRAKVTSATGANSDKTGKLHEQAQNCTTAPESLWHAQTHRDPFHVEDWVNGVQHLADSSIIKATLKAALCCKLLPWERRRHILCNTRAPLLYELPGAERV